MAEALRDRVAARLRELAQKNRGFQTRLAKRMGYRSPSGVTEYFKGVSSPPLEMIEAAAELAQCPPAEIVAEPGTVHILFPHEAALIRALRIWPKPVIDALVNFVAAFADEAPAAQQQKRIHALLRNAPKHVLDSLEPSLALLADKNLSRERQEQLGEVFEELVLGSQAPPKGPRRRRSTT